LKGVDYTYAHKSEFIKSMKEDLALLQDEVDRLSGKIERSSGAGKAEAERQLVAVRAQWKTAKSELEQAEDAQEADWDRMQSGFRKSHGELKRSIETMRQWLADKIEP